MNTQNIEEQAEEFDVFLSFDKETIGEGLSTNFNFSTESNKNRFI